MGPQPRQFVTEGIGRYQFQLAHPLLVSPPHADDDDGGDEEQGDDGTEDGQ